MRQALDVPPALAYRGCIAIGEFEAAADFMIGPAVDNAAELNVSGGLRLGEQVTTAVETSPVPI